jgi:eukaryotic-like serine/threonine-protein kinase
MSGPSAEFIALQRTLSGRYSLEREIGRGGMGIVFLARDVALNRTVAIKLLPPHYGQQPEMRARFLREARTAAGLFHPNIVPIHLVEEDGDLVFFVMAYVQGESVGARVRRAGPMPAPAVRRMIQEVAWALGYAHEKGVVHRDIKPDNILLERPGGRALVADFGIARVAETSGGTGRGELLGTVEYMSPEQATGEQVDGRSDLYSLGVTGFFALTGRLPFQAANAVALIHQHVNVPAPRVAVQARDVPAKLAEAVDRCLAKDPAQRFATGEELANAVSEAGTTPLGVPPEIRRLIRRIRVASTIVGLLSFSSMMITVLGNGSVADDIGLALRRWLHRPSSVGLTVLSLIVLFALCRPFVRLLRDARRAIRAGYGVAVVRDALSAEARALIEEGVVEAGQPRMVAAGSSSEASLVFLPSGDLLPDSVAVPDWEPENPVLKAGRSRENYIRYAPSLALGAIVFFTMSAHVVAGPFASGILALILLIISLFGIAAGPPVGKDSPLVALDWGERLLIGRFGHALFRVARWTMGARGRDTDIVPAGEPTEVALASAIDDLFDQLPRDVRTRFKDVHAVIRRLESDAATLRKRDMKLSDALARVEMHAPSTSRNDQDRLREELESARAAARTRLATTVSAIESVRLDLLRLQVGVGSPDDLTADLERARDIARAIDSELSSRDEVERVLTEPSA